MISRISRMPATRSVRSRRSARWLNTMDGGAAGSAERRLTCPRLCGRDKSIQNWKSGTAPACR